jgi:hypothetical protein
LKGPHVSRTLQDMSCTVCHNSIENTPITDPQTGDAYHVGCALGRGLDELVTAALAAFGVAVMSYVVVWAA